MAVDVQNVDFVIRAQDNATRVFKGVSSSLDRVKASYVALGAVFAVAAVFTKVITDIVALRSRLDDLADTTGDNVTTLDGLRRQAEISGVQFDQLGSTLSRLARNLNAADDEGKAAGAAIKAIGLDVEALRLKKPGEAMFEIALGLNKFEDGAAKVAVATALMGREGAKLLPYLKDLAEAGQLQGRITGEQTAAAERLEKEWRALILTFDDAKQALLGGTIPALNEFAGATREGIKIAGSYAEFLRLFVFHLDAMTAERAAEEIRRLTKALEEFKAAGGTGQFMQSPTGFLFGGREEDLKKQIEYLKFLQRQEALALPGAGEPDVLTRRFGRKEQLEFRAPDKEGAEREKRLLDEGRRGWIAYSDAVFNEAFELYTDLAKISTTYWENQDKLREDAMQAYFRIIDQDREREEITMRLIAGFDEEGNAIKKVDGAAEKLGFTFASAFENAIVEGGNLRDVLQGLAQDILRIYVRQTVTGPLAGMLASAFAGAFTAQHGLDFTVGGPGGVDSQFIPLWATPGERVRVETPQQQRASGGHIFYVDNRGASVEAVVRLEAFVRRIDATLERRAVTATFDAQMRGARP